MKHFLHMPIFFIALFFPLLIAAQVSADFESIPGVEINNSSCYYFDLNTTTVHQIQNYMPTCGGTITVLHPGAGADLGFEIILDPTTANGPIGFSDGDAIGVGTQAAITAELSAPPPQGTQAFMFEDVDGTVTMNFDEVDLTGTTSPAVSLQYILPSTGWEPEDFLKITVEITECGAATIITLIDTTTDPNGPDIDNITPSIEGSWNTLSANLNAYIGCKAELIIEHSSNSSSEELGIDDIQFTQGTVLPVEMSSFYAKVDEINEAIELNWETLSEINNEGFEVENSVDGINWNRLAFVSGIGNSVERNHYFFLHEKPIIGINYYRLKQLDFDGVFEYSKVIAVSFNNTYEQKISIVPNPASDKIFISSKIPFSKRAKIQLVSFQGQIILEKNINEIEKNLELNIGNFPEGIYSIRLLQDSGISTKKIIIRKD